MAKTEFIAANRRFKAWCKSALAYWHETALDQRGGYAEHLFMDETPDFAHIRRVRVQARLSYVYAHAGDVGWYKDARSASDHAWDFVTGSGFAGDIKGIPASEAIGCAHLVNGDGTLNDGLRDTYAQAFILLAGAWRYATFKDQEALKTAQDTLNFLDTHLKAGNGGWHESLPNSDMNFRRQNPHMHLFEAFLALYQATNDPKFLSAADDIFGLFETYFFDPQTQAVREFFYRDWSIRETGGGPAEPGHMMEWCWLLRFYEVLSSKNVRSYANALYDGGLAFGLNDATGLLYDSVAMDGSIVNATHRTWPLTEWIKASVAQASIASSETKLETYLTEATQGINSLFKYYLDVAPRGGWVDKLNAKGEVLSNVMPTSTFYHLFCAAVEVDKLSQKL